MAKIIILLVSTLVAATLAVPIEDLGSASSIYTPLQTYSSGAIISPGVGGAIVSPGVSTVYSSQGVYRSGYNQGIANLGYPVGGYSGLSGYGLGYNVIPISHGVEQRRTIGYYH